MRVVRTLEKIRERSRGRGLRRGGILGRLRLGLALLSLSLALLLSLRLSEGGQSHCERASQV